MASDQVNTHEDQLRAWARGMNTLVAATELLIRAGYAGRGRPWVRYDEARQRAWIDFQAIPELIGGMSGGEQRLLRIAASLGADIPIVLGDEVAGLERTEVELALTAIAHAAGFHDQVVPDTWPAGTLEDDARLNMQRRQDRRREGGL